MISQERLQELIVKYQENVDNESSVIVGLARELEKLQTYVKRLLDAQQGFTDAMNRRYHAVDEGTKHYDSILMDQHQYAMENAMRDIKRHFQ